MFTPTMFDDREWAPVELYLWLDPLVGVSAAIAARALNVALIGALFVLLLSVAAPRAFCGYLCPLGAMIGIGDWFVARARGLLKRGKPETTVSRPASRWRQLRFAMLAFVIGGALVGVTLSGTVAAIPVLTRGLMFSGGRAQFGLVRGWSEIGSFGAECWVSLGLFALVFALCIVGPRFWCRRLCPSGALLSLASPLRLTERRVDENCVSCGECIKACAFDAIAEDFSTRHSDCASCQTCGAVCPTGAITFGRRHPPATDGFPIAPPLPATVSRRDFLMTPACGVAGAVAGRFGIAKNEPKPLLRPPGSVNEKDFLALCVRCGECFKVCPGPTLHPAGFEHGLDALWTPVVEPTVAGCHPDCNFCTQICPTRAIRPLDLEAKKRFVMGIAKINKKTCLPYCGESDCRLCFDECEAVGYHAIEMREVTLDIDLSAIPPGVYSDMEIEEMSRIEAPFVIEEKCVGCGLCEYRCHAAYVRREGLLKESAVITLPITQNR